MQGALAAKLQHQRFDLENLEAEAVGTSIGASLGEYVGEKIDDYRKAQSVLRGQSITVSSPNDAANASSPYSNNQNNSTAQQLRRLGLFGSSGQNTSSSNGENDYIPFPRMGDGRGQLSLTSANNEDENLIERIENAYKNIGNWSEASLDRIKFWAESMSRTYSNNANQALLQSKQFLSAPSLDVMASETGNDLNYSLSQLANNKAATYSSYATSVNGLKWFGRAATIGNVYESANEVWTTYENGGDWKRVAFDQSAKLTGQYLGGQLGFVAAAYVTPETGGTSLIVAPAIAVGTGAVSGYYLEKYADQSYTYLFK